jgi:RNA polymerase sigma-B factor
MQHREREAEDLRAYADHREPWARERLVRRYLPLANSVARRFDRGKRVPLEDLQQVAAIGLIKALDRYDPANGAAFSTFAVPTMQGEIRRYFRDFTWTVRPPRELQERSIRIGRVREQLTNDLGRNPSARELAAQVGCTLEELVDASEAAQARTSDSFDRPITTQEGDAATLGERLGDEDPGFEAAEASATLDRLLDTLSERDQLVLRLRFRDDLTQSEIGRRIGCSQMHVSRILRAAVAQLVQNSAPSAHEQPELGRSRGRFRARAAAELGEDVANVHVDGTRAEEQRACDLAVRAADCDEPHDLELAPRQARALVVGRCAAA